MNGLSKQMAQGLETGEMAHVIVRDSYGYVQGLVTDPIILVFLWEFMGSVLNLQKLGYRDCCALSFRVLCGTGRRADTDIMKLL